MGPGQTKAADENICGTVVYLYCPMGVFFIVKKSDDEFCFDSLSVRMQRFT